LANKNLAYTRLSVLPDDYRARAYMFVARVITKKILPSDPYEDTEGQGYALTYLEYLDLCELVGYISHDTLAYALTQWIADSATGRLGRRLTVTQKKEIAGLLRDALAGKFPVPHYITHPGYRILADMQIARIQPSASVDWDSYEAEADAIPNLSDRAFVLMKMARCLPQRQKDRAIRLVKKARGIIEQIEVRADQCERLQHLADVSWALDREVSQESFRKALLITTIGSGSDWRERRLHLIDLAHRLNPAFAESLITRFDEDPARKAAAKELRGRIKECTFRENLQDPSSCDQIDEGERERMGRAAWQLLGSLHAGKVTGIKIAHARTLITHASQLPMREAYPVFAWITAALKTQYSGTAQAATTLRDVFEALCVNTELALRMITRAGTRGRRAHRRWAGQSRDATCYVRAGDRDAALSFLSRWLRSEVRGYVKFIDPFFGPEDLDLVQLIVGATSDPVEVQIVTSTKHIRNLGMSRPWEDCFKEYWRRCFAAPPPPTTIAIAGALDGGDLHVHDRWLVTQGAGLRLGTSFRSLGIEKDSEISVMETGVALEKENAIDAVFGRRAIDSRGRRLSFNIFDL